jgi:hypothetical protein
MKRPSGSTPGHFRSSWRAHRAAPRSRRFPEISTRPRALAAPVPTRHPIRIDLTKVQPKSLLPKHPEHTEYVVEINKLGQVTRIVSAKRSDSASFNAQTTGNALQAFIRTPDGHVVVGSYRLTYDFSPKTARVRRDVTLVRQGGVNPDAKGAAADMMDKVNAQAVEPNVAPNAASTIDPRALPELKGITEPAPAPSGRH